MKTKSTIAINRRFGHYVIITVILASLFGGFNIYKSIKVEKIESALESYGRCMCQANRDLKYETEYLEDLNAAKDDLLSGRRKHSEVKYFFKTRYYTLEGDVISRPITDLRDDITETEKKIETLKAAPETFKYFILKTYHDTPVYLREYIDFNRYALKANIASLND